MRTNGFVGLIIAGICCFSTQALYAQTDFPVEPSNESEGVFRISNASENYEPASEYYEPAIDAVSFAPSSPRTSDLSPIAMSENYSSGEYYGPIEEYTQGDWIEEPYLEDMPYERLGIVAGVAAVFVKPGFDTDTAFLTEDQSGMSTITTSNDFPYNYQSAPRINLGLIDNEGLSAQIRWFQFEDNSNNGATSPNNFVFFNGLPTKTTTGGLRAGGQAGDFITTSSNIKLYTIDLDISQELNFERWQTTFGGGYRHASVSQTYQARGTASGAAVSSDAGHRFDGNGLVIFGEARRPLGLLDRRSKGSSSLSLISSLKYSALWGNSKYSAEDRTPGPTVAIAQTTSKKSLSIAEIQIGMQADFVLQTGALVWVRAAWDGMWWNGAGSAASESGDLSLLGGSISLGMDW
ncbi:Lpg1974 family pore-forming outer membrane protein [uncultured Gimesia sp.]|uniref:Lpg1974 family pore-forming outer membrane protein n=1 Tax=uncultured Gimesia sp. TaxID=1678688 RepID=UPI0030DC11AD|tara:strand:+ start:174289 stop:175509 length:1221 start_codon:yes stop_codon:yes gene_type:complete